MSNDSVNTVVDRKAGWIEPVVGCLLAIVACAALRLIEAPKWDVPALMAGDGHLMSTHDAYAWLAGAKNINFQFGQQLSIFLKYTAEWTGLPLGVVGFWMPAILAPLSALPICIYAARQGLAFWGIAAGIMSGSAYGYLIRTRLGSIDTDVLTLFFPVLLGVVLIELLGKVTEPTWRLSLDREGEKEEPDWRLLLGFALVLGLIGRWYYTYYLSGLPIICSMMGLGFGIALFFGKNGIRIASGTAVVLGTTCVLGGELAIIGTAILFVLSMVRKDLFNSIRLDFVVLGVCAVYIIIFNNDLLFKFVEQILYWLKPAVEDNDGGAQALKLPAVLQSIREAQNIPLDQIVNQIAWSWWILVPSLLGYAWLLFRKPEVAVFIPLLGLAFASVKMGSRFSMYGGPVIGLGILGLGMIVRDLTENRIYQWTVALAAALIVFYPLYDRCSALGPYPVLPRTYAESFIALKNSTPKDSWLWQWWDYGYAGQFYAERYTFGDGARHDGNWLFPLARVHATRNQQEAAQLMKLTAQGMMKEAKESPHPYDGLPGSPERLSLYYVDPMKQFDEIGAVESQRLIRSLGTQRMDFEKDLPEQYLVLSWENLNLGQWILNFGLHNLVTGGRSKAQISRVQGRVNIDTKTGTLNAGQIRNAKLTGLDLINQQGLRHLRWRNKGGYYAIMNQLSNQVYIMDAAAYNSMMVQMLVNDPARFSNNFELVYNGFPWGRVYRVK